MVKLQDGALVVMPDPFFFDRREQLIALAARYAMPTIYFSREFTEIGGPRSGRAAPGTASGQALFSGRGVTV
jgi:hypothetical protein